MIDRHQKENWELMKAHLQAQEEVLKKLMQSQQQLQIKELEAFFEKYVTVALPQHTDSFDELFYCSNFVKHVK